MSAGLENSLKVAILALSGAMLVVAVVFASCGLPGGESDPDRPAWRTEPGREYTQRTPDCSNADRYYIEAVQRHMRDSAGALDTISRLSASASRNAALIASDRWRGDMIAALSRLQAVADALEALSSPSSRLRDAHGSAGDLAYALRGVVRNMAEGIDYLDAGAIERAVLEMEYGASVAEVLTVQLRNACR